MPLSYIHIYVYILVFTYIYTWAYRSLLKRNPLLTELLVDHLSIDNLDHLFSAILNIAFQDRLTLTAPKLPNSLRVTEYWNPYLEYRVFDFQLQIPCGTITNHFFIYMHKIHCLFFSACAINLVLVTYNVTSNLLTVEGLNKNGCCWNNATSFDVTDDHPSSPSDDFFSC